MFFLKSSRFLQRFGSRENSASVSRVFTGCTFDGFHEFPHEILLPFQYLHKVAILVEQHSRHAQLVVFIRRWRLKFKRYGKTAILRLLSPQDLASRDNVCAPVAETNLLPAIISIPMSTKPP
jgi:hypothetical protein